MKQFVWRLQKVLDIKEKQERLKQTELFRLAQELAQRRSELLMQQRALQDIMSVIVRDRSARRLVTQEFFLKHAATNDEQIRRLQDKIAELEAQQREKVAEVLALRRFKEALQRLRAEAKERFIREQEKLEQKELDDRTVAAFARQESMKKSWAT
jgi:flagellar biosynthesis chaperone FliJ